MVKLESIRVGETVNVLSPLENDVIKTLWKSKCPMKVRDIHKLLERKVALTSVAVILDRLYEKKMVQRKRETGRGGEHYIYSSSCSKSDFEECVLEKTIDGLLQKYGKTAENYMKKRFSK